MTRPPISTDEMQAVKRCFEAYGADPAKWPDDRRAAYGALADAPGLAEARAEAEALDGFLGAASAPPPAPDALKSRMLAEYQTVEAGLSGGGALSKIGGAFARFFDQGALLPAGALAGVAGLGALVGALTAQPVASLSPEAAAYAYVEDALTLAFLDTEETIE